VKAFGRTWQAWDVDGFVGLFSDDAVFVDHPTTETLSGGQALRAYVLREAEEQGAVTVRMGKPLVDGNQVAAEFWVAMVNPGGEPSDLVGSFIAQLDPADGRCTQIREYWFEIPGHVTPYDGWGE
jgi:ketosteroid isomerase-like protein